MTPSEANVVHMAMRVDETGSNDLVRAIDHLNALRRDNVCLDLRNPVIFYEKIRLDATGIAVFHVDYHDTVLEQRLCGHGLLRLCRYATNTMKRGRLMPLAAAQPFLELKMTKRRSSL